MSFVDEIKKKKADYCWQDVIIVSDDLEGQFRVLCDALKVNGIRINVSAKEAQLIADELDAVLPTAKILDVRYRSASIQAEPQPKYYEGGVGMDTQMACIEHDERVSAAVGEPRAGIVQNVGKHWVLDRRATKERSVLYGWHVDTQDVTWKGIKLHHAVTPGLRVIQPVSTAHDYHHKDYSMTLVLMHGECLVNGKKMKTKDVLTDPDLCRLLTHDGVSLPSARLPLGDEEPEDSHIIDPYFEPPTIRKGDTGTWVKTWQHVLITEGFDLTPYGADGQFGKATESMTKAWQNEMGLVPDGIVGPKTWSAVEVGVDPAVSVRQRIFAPSDYPKHPPFAPVHAAQRNDVFGKIEFVPAPVPGNPEQIKITNGWAANVEMVPIPQLSGVPGFPSHGKVAWHKDYVDELTGLFRAWEEAKLLDFVCSWAGSWNPRFIRGSRKTLSNHSWATAMDINSPWNPLGSSPKPANEKGTVIPLVPIANDFGFYWGGHFHSRPDGMHFEIAPGNGTK